MALFTGIIAKFAIMWAATTLSMVIAGAILDARMAKARLDKALDATLEPPKR